MSDVAPATLKRRGSSNRSIRIMCFYPYKKTLFSALLARDPCPTPAPARKQSPCASIYRTTAASPCHYSVKRYKKHSNYMTSTKASPLAKAQCHKTSIVHSTSQSTFQSKHNFEKDKTELRRVLFSNDRRRRDSLDIHARTVI